MAIKNLGNFKRTVGVYEMSIPMVGFDEDMVIEFEKITPSMILEFKDVFGDYLNAKDKTLIMKFIKQHLIDTKQFEGSDFNDEDIDMFVADSLEKLITEYMIMFRLTTREDLEKSVAEATSKVQSKKR